MHGPDVAYLANQDLDGPYRVILIDNGSTDGTAEIAEARAQVEGSGPHRAHGDHARQEQRPQRRQGRVETPLVITVDADTLLHRSALRLLLARYESSPDDVVAVAGSVLVRNRGSGPACQEWDYFLGIASVKRMQGLYQGTLVAQGAFSL